MADAPKPRWYRLTPDRLVLFLLAVEGLLWLSERFQLFPKGYAVLIAVSSVGVFLLAMFLWFVIALIFRLRFQYSIRSLLLLTLAVALQCSWLAVERDEAKRQREAVKAIGDMLGSVMYDYDTGKSGPYTMFVSPPGQIWLRNVLGEDFFNNIATVNFLANPYVSDEDSGRIEGIIKALPQIQRLDLSGTQVTDAGVAKLKQALPGCRINH